MKIVIAPDSFKGSLSALDVAKAIERGIKRVDDQIETVLIPMADGGEGTAQSLVDATHGKIVQSKVHDPLMRLIDAYYGILGDEQTAVIEMATASGLPLLKAGERNPLKTTTFGTGELIKDALDKGCVKFIIGIGGSATNDGGCGMAQALGAKLLNSEGKEIGLGGAELSNISSIDLSEIDSRIEKSSFIAACDVDNPLCGTQGASMVYGPQKGASLADVQLLDKALEHFADTAKKQYKIDIKNIPGSGAAGGLGAGILFFLKAQLKRGIDIVSEAASLSEKMEGAHLIITGEGSIDFQTAFGKTPFGVAQVAKMKHIPVIALAGSLGKNYQSLYTKGFNGIFSIIDKPMKLEEAIKKASKLVENASTNIINLLMKHTYLLIGKEKVKLTVPTEISIFEAEYPDIGNKTESDLLNESLKNSCGEVDLETAVKNRKPGKVVIVVSDITRPIPYSKFLPSFLEIITNYGVDSSEVIILVATGMHRPSTPEEKIEMFGEEIAKTIEIIDHNAEDDANLVKVNGQSFSGTDISLNRFYMEAGLRIITSLVEPHFMAGFSGGRKTICPGLASLSAIKNFHGFKFLNDQNSRNNNLKNNPCHKESLSIARLARADFAIHVVLDNHKKLNKVFSGDMEASHLAAIDYVKGFACPKVEQQFDVVITSCGGYPLDATFYQCVKGFVNAATLVKKGGVIIAVGGCSEGTGSQEYQDTMERFHNDYENFLDKIEKNEFFIKDQWQFQMHTRVLQKIGRDNLIFYTDHPEAISNKEILAANFKSCSIPEQEKEIAHIINSSFNAKKSIAILPEGPYCSPNKNN